MPVPADDTPAKATPVTAKNPAKDDGLEDFAVTDDDLDELTLDFAGSGDNQWREEYRHYTKKDGTPMVYWNLRSRKSSIDPVTSKRKIPYKKGGKFKDGSRRLQTK